MESNQIVIVNIYFSSTQFSFRGPLYSPTGHSHGKYLDQEEDPEEVFGKKRSEGDI